MQYFVTKSGLDRFDACRAYGMAELLHALTRGRLSPTIADVGGAFLLTLPSNPSARDVSESEEWHAVFALPTWAQVFLTYKGGWSDQRDKVRAALEKNVTAILAKGAVGLAVDLGGDCTLPGAMDPTVFKGLKGLTRGSSFEETQTGADEMNWALGCLGAAVAQCYRRQRIAGNKWEYYVTLPVPEQVRYSDFHAIRGLVYQKGLRYVGVRNASAHFSLRLADAIRQKAAGNPSFPLRFSTVAYFSLFRSGQQFKPSLGGALHVAPLICMALEEPALAAEVFSTWDYLFRRGSRQGAEDLAAAVTELIMAPSVESYYCHARVLLRYIVDRNKGVKRENLYTETALREVLKYVS